MGNSGRTAGVGPVKLDHPGMIRFLFLLCWAAYFATYLGRLNFSAGLAEIIRAEGLSKAQGGAIGTGFFFAYGAGQLVNGFLGDRLPPKYMIFAGLALSGAANLGMSASASYGQMLVIWCLNGFIQSLVWSPILVIFFRTFTTAQWVKSSIHINSTVPVGTLCTYALTALMILLASWRGMFLLSGLVLFGMSGVWLWGMGRVERHLALHGVYEAKPGEEEPHAPPQENYLPLAKILAISGLPLLCLALLAQGALKDGVTTWAPTYLTERFGLEVAASVIATTLIPLLNFGGVYLAAWARRRLFRDEVRTSAALFGVCSLCILILRLAGGAMGLSLGLLAGATTAMMGVNTMLVSVLPGYFGRYGRASTVSGILNSTAYAGCALSSYGFGALSAGYGWDLTISSWLGLALLGLCACLGAGIFWKRFQS